MSVWPSTPACSGERCGTTGLTWASAVPGSTSVPNRSTWWRLPYRENLGQHFAIRVGDLDSVVGELRAKGIEVGDPVAVGANRQTFINDPAGNAVELHQVGGAS